MHFISRTTEQQEISSNFAKGMNEGGYCQCPVSALPRHKIKLCAYFDDSNDREVSTNSLHTPYTLQCDPVWPRIVPTHFPLDLPNTDITTVL